MIKNSAASPANCATVHLPPQATGHAEQNIACVCEVYGKQMTLLSQSRIPSSAFVSVEYKDAMFLGEVISCAEDGNGHWRVEIEVEQILNGLVSLLNLRARLMGEAVPDRVNALAR